MTERTCQGRCCEYFMLPWVKNYDELQQRANEAEKEDRIEAPQLRIVADMVIPLYARSRPGYNRNSNGETTWYYGCKHYDKQTRLCTNYEGRPDMCRSYPARGRACEHSRTCSYRREDVHAPLRCEAKASRLRPSASGSGL